MFLYVYIYVRDVAKRHETIVEGHKHIYTYTFTYTFQTDLVVSVQ